MTIAPIELLSALVHRYDERGEPVTPAELAETVDADAALVREQFESFESKHLSKCVGAGYRPTVTARELLELDIGDDALVILDAQPES